MSHVCNNSYIEFDSVFYFSAVVIIWRFCTGGQKYTYTIFQFLFTFVFLCVCVVFPLVTSIKTEVLETYFNFMYIYNNNMPFVCSFSFSFSLFYSLNWNWYCFHIGNLRNMAIDMGSELGNQNNQIDRINRKVSAKFKSIIISVYY